MRVLRMLAIVALLGACGSVETGSVRPAEAEVFAAASSTLVPLPDGRLVLEMDARLIAIAPGDPTSEPIVIGPATDVGEVHAVVPTQGAVLVLASGGTFLLRGEAWVPTDLGMAFDGPIVDAVRLPSPTGIGLGDLWVATATSLYRIVDDEAQELALDEDLSDVELAIAPRPEGPALWVKLPDRVLEVWRDRSGVVRTARLGLETAPSAIGGSAAPTGGSTTGWLVIDGGLFSIGADRVLVDRGVRVDRLLTSPLADEVWALGPDGPRLFADGARLEVEGAALPDDAPVALAADGSLFVSDGAAVRRVSPRRQVTVGGAPDGSLLVRPQVFPVAAEGSPLIEAQIDGAAVELLTEPLRVELDPAELGEGSHTLEIRVTYDDGTLPVLERRTFEVVTNATWADDIQPIYDTYCGQCHGPEGPANTRLDAPGDWQEIFEVVVANVEDGRMPLNNDPLTQREIAIIQAWEVGGFAQ